MAVTEKDLLNVIFDDASAPQEKASAVAILKRLTKQDRDTIVSKFDGIKRKRSPPRDPPTPQDAKKIKELEDIIESVPLWVIKFFVRHRKLETPFLAYFGIVTPVLIIMVSIYLNVFLKIR